MSVSRTNDHRHRGLEFSGSQKTCWAYLHYFQSHFIGNFQGRVQITVTKAQSFGSDPIFTGPLPLQVVTASETEFDAAQSWLLHRSTDCPGVDPPNVLQRREESWEEI
jgi:hypothetical protein